jgi:uncharacterized protein
MSEILQPQEPGIPLPRPGLFSQPYWDAASQKRLTYQRCRQCGHIPRLPSRACVSCQGGELEWLTSSGRGRLYSWTVVWRPQHPSFKVPYAPAVMAVDEGWWLMTSVIGCAPGDLRDGLPLQVEFHPAGGDIWLPYARPREDAGAGA